MSHWSRVTEIFAGRNTSKGSIISLFLLVLLVTSRSGVGAEEHGADDAARLQVENIFDEHTALVFVDTLIAPQYFKGKLVHHVFYDFALLVDREQWGRIQLGQLRLREVFLDELNRASFAVSAAPKRINIPLLKKHLLARAQRLFGQEGILGLYVMDAVPGKL